MNRSILSSIPCLTTALILVLVIKLLLAWIIPITADEAYYAIWGTYLSGGGYDHPPMIGFVLYPLLKLGHHALMLRLPALFSSFILGGSLYLYLKQYHPDRAVLASLLLIISPISLFNIIITTDTPLLIFSFLSVMCVLQALKKNDDWRWFSLGGLFLGLAFYSKYFAGLLVLAYAAYLLLIAPNRSRIIGLLLLALLTLPFVAQNLYWNYQHNWSNILFNIYNRNQAIHFSYKTILGYGLILFYLITPPLLYSIITFPKKELKKQALFYFFFIPLILFLGLSCFKSIGLHWPLAFIPLIYSWAGEYLNEAQLKKLLKFTLYWSGIQLALIFIVISIPMNWVKKLAISNTSYSKIVYFFEHDKVHHFLSEKYAPTYLLASPNYANASLFFYDTYRYAPVFLKGSYHGREDDFITDFKKFNDKNFIIFSHNPIASLEYQPFFEKIEQYSFKVKQANFYYLVGDKFNYPLYREKILKTINDTYWKVPSYLPHAPSFFYLKYFRMNE